jgi:hypothetical protein
VSELDNFLKHKIMCMRLAAECRGLAADAPEADLKEHFLRLANSWEEIADRPRVLH